MHVCQWTGPPMVQVICSSLTPSQCLCWLNSLAPGRSGCDSKNGIFNLVLLIGIFRLSRDNALRWMPQDLTDDKSTLVQVMAWCRQATSHYLNQCWPRSLLPYGITRPQWVKENAFQNGIFKMQIILFKPQCVMLTSSDDAWRCLRYLFQYLR